MIEIFFKLCEINSNKMLTRILQLFNLYTGKALRLITPILSLFEEAINPYVKQGAIT
jgi:hypothetical protein